MSKHPNAEAGHLSPLAELYFLSLDKHKTLPAVTWIGARGETTTLTFAAFHEQVRLRANHLIESTAPGDCIVTIGGNSINTLAQQLAVILSARVLCPINPEEGALRIKEKIQKLNLRAHVWVEPTQQPRLFGLGELGEPADTPTATEPNWPRASPTAPEPRVLIFTSGSTGYSKVVEQMEEGIVANVKAVITHHGLAPGETVATPLPIFHVNAFEFAFLGCLFSGARLVLLEKFVPDQIDEVIERESVTIVSLVPSLLRRWISVSRLCANSTNALRYALTAAAPLPKNLVQECLEKTGLRVIQGYGLSEAINFSCTLPIDLSTQEYERWMLQEKWPSIGVALPGNTLSIRRANGTDAGENEEGEICVAGSNVMRGYRGEACSPILPDGRLLTGDLGFYKTAPDGRRFYFVSGRSKDVIKKNGLTISLREVDDCLLSFGASIGDAISVGFEHALSGEEIGAVIRPGTGWNPSSEGALARHLEQILPAFAVPRILLLSDTAELRTPSGKPCRWRFAAHFEPYRAVSPGRQSRYFTLG